MGQVLHRSATTTEAVRRAIQHSQESMRTLARRHGVNPKTSAKWKKRESTADRRTGPTVPRSTVFSVEQEAIIVAFRKHTLLQLDDCLYALQATIPQLNRSSLPRCLERHGISRLPDVEGNKPKRKKFDTYPIGFFHIDLAEVRTAEGKLYLLVAIERTSKFAVVELAALIVAVPYRIHTVLTDNGIQFADLPKNRQGLTARLRGHPFDRLESSRHKRAPAEGREDHSEDTWGNLFDSGEEARFNGVPFDEERTTPWKEGWVTVDINLGMLAEREGQGGRELRWSCTAHAGGRRSSHRVCAALATP